MDLWDLGLIYAPVSAPCRSVRAPGADGDRSHPQPPAAAEVGLGLLWAEFTFAFEAQSKGLLLCLFPLCSSKAGPRAMTWWRKGFWVAPSDALPPHPFPS